VKPQVTSPDGGYKHLKGTHDKGRIAEEPGEGKLCAMSRTEGIAS